MAKTSTTGWLVLLLTALAPATSSAFIPRQTLPLAADAEPETRVRGIDPGAEDCTGAEEPATLELRCEICLEQLGIASGFRIYANGNPLRYTDPTGTVSAALLATYQESVASWEEQYHFEVSMSGRDSPQALFFKGKLDAARSQLAGFERERDLEQNVLAPVAIPVAATAGGGLLAASFKGVAWFLTAVGVFSGANTTTEAVTGEAWHVSGTVTKLHGSERAWHAVSGISQLVAGGAGTAGLSGVRGPALWGPRPGAVSGSAASSRLEGRWGSGGPTTPEEVVAALRELRVKVPHEIEWRVLPDAELAVRARAHGLNPAATEALYFPARPPTSPAAPISWEGNFLSEGRLPVYVRESVMSNPFRAVQRFAHEAAEIRGLRASFMRAAELEGGLTAGQVSELISPARLRNLHTYANDYADIIAGARLKGMSPADLLATQNRSLAQTWTKRFLAEHRRRTSLRTGE